MKAVDLRLLVAFGFVLACCVGIGITAYRTPRGYRYLLLMPALIAIGCLVVVACMAASTVH